MRRPYFFFFPFAFFDPDGNTLATALTIDPATFATTPFLAARFFAFGFDLVVRAFGALFLVDFFAAVFAITDSPTRFSFQIMLISRPSSAFRQLAL